MALREISRAAFLRIIEQRGFEVPIGTTEAGWFACNEFDFLAVLLYHMTKADWQCVVYQCDRVETPSAAAALTGFARRSDAEFAMRSKMQQLVLSATVAERETASESPMAETA